jgi:ribosomal protein S18 acetylase RimI-like enzyme
LGDQMIGLCRVNFGEDKPGIYTVGISPQLQGRGYGAQMLNLVLEMLIGMGYQEVVIDVDSENASAYHLYRKAGFAVQTQFDYYEYPV